MGFVFRKSYERSLSKKWYPTSMPPICTYTQVAPLNLLHTAQPCKMHTTMLLARFVPSGLFPDLHLPTSVFAVPTSRTASKLCVFYLCPLGEHIRIGTPQGTSGGSGSVISPYFRMVTLSHVYHLYPFYRVRVAKSSGESSLSLFNYSIPNYQRNVKLFLKLILHLL